MAQLVSSFESIRQTLNNGQFDACENLLRDLLGNAEVDAEARPFIKEVLASVMARRALDHSRNFVARGNLEAARRVMHRVWHQFENEGLEDVSEHAREAIITAATDSEDPGFDADELGAIIDHYLGNAYFDSLMNVLPEEEYAGVPTDRATAIVKAAEIKPVQRMGATSVVIDPNNASVGQAILKSLARPRVIIIALLVFAAVASIGWFTRESTYRTEFTLLRPTGIGDDGYSAKVHSLPKQTLQGLPTQAEVVGPVSKTIQGLITDDLLRDSITPRKLKGMISATVAAGDYGTTDSTIKVVFDTPTEDMATQGGKALMDRVIEVHNEIVTRDIHQAINGNNERLAQIATERKALSKDLQDKTKNAIIPGGGGDHDQMREVLLKMLTEAQKGYDTAVAKAQSAKVRSSKIAESLTGEDALPETVEWITESPETVVLLIQPLLLQLNADKQRHAQLQSRATAGNYGQNHPVRIELRSLAASIVEQQAKIDEIESDAKKEIRSSKTTRNNAARDSMVVEARLAAALQAAHEAEKEAWRNALDKTRAALTELDDGEDSAGALATRLVNLVDEQDRLRTESGDLERFAARNPGGLTVMSDLSEPEANKSSLAKLFLAAVGLAFLAALIVSFTGGHRAVHMVILGLIATLFHVR